MIGGASGSAPAKNTPGGWPEGEYVELLSEPQEVLRQYKELRTGARGGGGRFSHSRALAYLRHSMTTYDDCHFWHGSIHGQALVREDANDVIERALGLARLEGDETPPEPQGAAGGDDR